MTNLSSHIVKILLFFVFAVTTPSHALERDYSYSGRSFGQSCDDYDDDGFCLFLYESDEFCFECFDRACWSKFYKHKNHLDINAIPPNMHSLTTCSVCWDPTVYSGYLHFRYKNDCPFLKRQIAYAKKYPGRQHYWPETSEKALKINDLAISLFRNLINSSALNRLEYNEALARDFITDSWYFESLGYALPISLCMCFRFSDFYQVSKDLAAFSEDHFNENESLLIQEKLDVILDRLCPLFLEMYEESLSVFPTDEIIGEVKFIELLYNSDGGYGKGARNRHSSIASNQASILLKKFSFEMAKTDNPKANPPNIPDWLIADYWLYEGVQCNDLFLHSDALIYLNASIAHDENNVEAYQERIHAHFEMGNLNLAIEDYKKLKQLEMHKKSFLACRFADTSESYVVNPEPKGVLDCYVGFHVGILKGSAVAVIEFVPSTLSCCKGVLHGLWSFSCSPVEVSKDLINTSYQLVKFIKENTARENLELVIPELKELCLNWDSLTDYERGNQIGYIIGKYGLDVLIPGAIIKGIKKYRHLKRLNSMFTVECCMASEAKQAKILEASAKHAAIRTTVVDAAKTGKVIPKNANVVPHVMQKKHAWDKLIKISGNQQEDFIAVKKLLEEHKILDAKNFVKELIVPPEKPNSPLRLLKYEKTVNSELVETFFIKNVETGEIYLTDAWVKTK